MNESVTITIDRYNILTEHGRKLIEKEKELADKDQELLNKDAEIKKIIDTIADKDENVVVVDETRTEIWMFNDTKYKVDRSNHYHYATKSEAVIVLTEKITELKKHNTDYHDQMKKLIAENIDLKKQIEAVKPKKKWWQ